VRLWRCLFRRKPSESGPEGPTDPVPEWSPLPGPDTARTLHLSLGPVQGFVAQARRTRDLWAGSFLLSWLAGQAMAALPDAPGRVRFRHPAADKDPLYRAIRYGEPCPYEPSLPNEFAAEIDAGVAFDPRACADRVHACWRGLATLVWRRFLQGRLGADEPRAGEIWNRQVGTASAPGPFWEVAWVLVPEERDRDDWLTRRKLWRTWREGEAPEAGDMCTLMGDWQEISGHTRTRRDSRLRQREFWERVRGSLAAELRGGGSRGKELVEMREGERLCAIALVKRLFPLLPPDELATAIGWSAPAPRGSAPRPARRVADSYRPSTAYLAAAHWLERAQAHAPGACREFAALARQATPALAAGERHSRLGLRVGDLAPLDGKLFFEGSYRQTRTELPGLPDDRKAAMLDLLARIRKAPLGAAPAAAAADDGEAPLDAVGAPSPYYAVLRMDGDETGRLLAEHPRELPEALADFADAVRQTVRGRHGELVYAGGDDLLALLPLEDALPAAGDVRGLWRKKVASRIEGATISAGVAYAHYEVALRWALAEAGHLLDDVAKGANGRDSLAVSVFGRNGRMLEWASTWEAGGGDAAALLDGLARRGRDETRGLCANRFVHGLAERLSGFFCDPVPNRRGLLLAGAEPAPPVGAGEAKALWRALGGRAVADAAEEDLDALLLLLRPHWREQGRARSRAAPWQVAPLLLLRFLAAQWRALPP
jgi:CRISPR-associated protein Cmr2